MSTFTFELKYQVEVTNPDPAIQRGITSTVQSSIAQLMRDLRHNHRGQAEFVGFLAMNAPGAEVQSAFLLPSAKES